MKENKAIARERKNFNFVPKDVQRILSSHKFSEMHNEHKVFYKKSVLKHCAIITGKHLCWNLFCIKNAGLQASNFIKKRLQHKCFLVNIERCYRAPILKNSCDRLLLRVPLERFPT